VLRNSVVTGNRKPFGLVGWYRGLGPLLWDSKFLGSEIAVSRKGGMGVRRLKVGGRRSDGGCWMWTRARGDECG